MYPQTKPQDRFLVPVSSFGRVIFLRILGKLPLFYHVDICDEVSSLGTGEEECWVRTEPLSPREGEEATKLVISGPVIPQEQLHLMQPAQLLRSHHPAWSTVLFSLLDFLRALNKEFFPFSLHLNLQIIQPFQTTLEISLTLHLAPVGFPHSQHTAHRTHFLSLNRRRPAGC